MLKNIDVRFFSVRLDDDGEVNLGEIDYQEFDERFAENPHATFEIGLHSVFENGVRQLCITLNEVG